MVRVRDRVRVRSSGRVKAVHAWVRARGRVRARVRTIFEG